MHTHPLITVFCLLSLVLTACSSAKESKSKSTKRPTKAKPDRKPRTPIDFFCEGFAKAVAQGVPRHTLLSSTAYTAMQTGGPALSRNEKKWSNMTETDLLAEIKKNGNPLLCARFASFLRRSDMLQKRSEQRAAEKGNADIPLAPKKPCDALETCCKAIPDKDPKAKETCLRVLQSAKDVAQPAWCQDGLKRYRSLCTQTRTKTGHSTQ